MIRYTKEEIKGEWEKIKRNPNLIYRNGANIFNYKGRLKDENILYADYISKLLIEDFPILRLIGKNDDLIRKTKSFNLNHNGITDDTLRQNKYGYTKFDENPFAIALFNSAKEYPFGKIIQYQIPLTESGYHDIGVLDLIGLKNKNIFLIELKKKSEETLLRAIMEIFTFSIFINIRKEKFCVDFNLPQDSNLIPTILTFKGSLCETHLKMLKKDKLPHFRRLLELMNQYLNSMRIKSFRFFTFIIDEPPLEKDEKGRTIIAGESINDQDIYEYFL